MRKVILLFLTIFLLSCTKGVWIDGNIYRPKQNKFSILKTPFVYSSIIDTNFFYRTIKKNVNYDGSKLFSFSGFYSNGKMIGNTYSENNLNKEINKSNSWDTAKCIGFYRIINNNIQIQFFIPSDGGLYETKEGIIKKDTIILESKVRSLLKVEIRRDTLVKSEYPIK